MRRLINSDEKTIINVLKQLGFSSPDKYQVELIHSLIAEALRAMPFHFCKILSSREKECLYWTAQGKSTKEMAEILGIKVNTVTSYKHHLLRKLGCRNMAQAIFEGIQCGYLKKVL